MPGFHVEHFGCRAARADGEAVSSRLVAAGHCIEVPAEADVVVVNTCSVTAEADRQARAFIRRTHRTNPSARIVVTGCYAQRAPDELAALAGVAAVVGNSHKALAPAIAMELSARDGGSTACNTHTALATNPGPAAAQEITARSNAGAPQLVGVQALLGGSAAIYVDDRFAHSFLEEAQLTPGAQTRPNLKIQEGCGNRCTFCVIPQTRGSSRSLAADRVLSRIDGFVAAGGNELVLSGINLGRWGRDRLGHAFAEDQNAHPAPANSHRTHIGEDGAPTVKLAALLRRIFRETSLPRLRLSSIEPMDWDAELIGLMAEFGGGRLARHAHLPLQSGSDAVLRRMHRRYRPWHYAEKVAALQRAAGPELTLGADVMAGFPGETDSEFEETLQMIQALPLGYLHLFPFSPRPGTRGWALHAERPVSPHLVAERMAALRELAAEKSRAHRLSFVGRTLQAITLRTAEAVAARGRTEALTENFLPVELAGCVDANRLVRVQITGISAAGAGGTGTLLAGAAVEG